MKLLNKQLWVTMDDQACDLIFKQVAFRIRLRVGQQIWNPVYEQTKENNPELTQRFQNVIVF